MDKTTLTMMLCSLGFTACRGGDVPIEMPTCSDGEVRLGSTGAGYSSLGAALAEAGPEDAICLGAGTFDAGSARLERDVQRLRIQGAGAGETVLSGSTGSLKLIALDAQQSVGVEVAGLTFEGVALDIWCSGQATLRDLVVTGHTEQGAPPLRVNSDQITIDQLDIHDNALGSGVTLSSGREISADALWLRNNQVLGHGLVVTGPITWRDGRVEGNRSADPGDDNLIMVGSGGAASIFDLVVSDNAIDGPLITAVGDEVSLYDATVTDNSSSRWTTISAEHTSLRISGGSFQQNAAEYGLIGLAAWSDLQMLDVDFLDGPDDDACEVAYQGDCLTDDLGVEASGRCGVEGCDIR